MSGKLAIAIMIILTVTAAVAAFAAGPDTVVGLWTLQDGTARVEIYKADDGSYEGKLAWLEEVTYSKGDPEEGKPRRDRLNPEKSLQNRPLQGLVMLSGFKHNGDNGWKGGTIYDPQSGKTYKCKMTLDKDGKLEVRGFIGISLLGRTEIWTRYKEEKK